MTMHYITMGVAGCGKTTVGQALAQKLELPFFDGDDYHPVTNVEKMTAGVALTDEDRWPWLQKLLELMNENPSGTVISCSALKQTYRTFLRQQSVCFVFLDVAEDTIVERVRRREHFFPESLIRDQFASLDVPSESEAICLDGTATIEAICAAVINA